METIRNLACSGVTRGFWHFLCIRKTGGKHLFIETSGDTGTDGLFPASDDLAVVSAWCGGSSEERQLAGPGDSLFQLYRQFFAEFFCGIIAVVCICSKIAVASGAWQQSGMEGNLTSISDPCDRDGGKIHPSDPCGGTGRITERICNGSKSQRNHGKEDPV